MLKMNTQIPAAFAISWKVVVFLALIAFSTVPETNAADWQLGPFVKQDSVNPIMGALADTEFLCPVRNEVVNWEEKDVFNPTALVRSGIVHLLYRAEDVVGIYNGTSRIGLAMGNTPIDLTRDPEPIFYPDNDELHEYEWEGGCEDPRIVESEDGEYVLMYTSYDGVLARLCVATSRDVRRWTKHGPVFKKAGHVDVWSKAGAIITTLTDDGRFVATKIDGKYWMYWGETSIYIASSPDLITWTPLGPGPGDDPFLPVFGPRPDKFDSDIVEPGPQAIMGSEGILLIYNARNLHPEEGGDPNLPKATYSAGQVLLDAKRPWLLLDRTEQYFMTPEKDYEIIGQVGNVVFLEGLIYWQDKWYLYYGTADSKIAVAVAESHPSYNAAVAKTVNMTWLLACALALMMYFV